MAKVLGIDLGTTNSVMAVIEAGQPTLLVNSEGSRLTPSFIAIHRKSGERLVRQLAKNQAATNLANTVFSMKRPMGRQSHDPEVQYPTQRVPYQITNRTP